MTHIICKLMSEINSVGLANIILHTIKFEWQRSDAAVSSRHRAADALVIKNIYGCSLVGTIYADE